MASVRSEAKAQDILELHPNWEDKVSFVYVPDVAAERAFDHVFKDAKTSFDFIIHTASPATLFVTDFQKELIDPAVQGFVDGGHLMTCSTTEANRPEKNRWPLGLRSSTRWIQDQTLCAPWKYCCCLEFFQR